MYTLRNKIDVELLELRTHRSAGVTLNDGLLHIDGVREEANSISISRSGDKVVALVNGKTFQFRKNAIQKILVETGAGKDKIEVKPSVDAPATLRGGPGLIHLASPR